MMQRLTTVLDKEPGEPKSVVRWTGGDVAPTVTEVRKLDALVTAISGLNRTRMIAQLTSMAIR
jgi:hypothetical protein